MRNLRTISHRVGKAAAHISATCWDASKDEVLIACGPSTENQRIELLRVVQDQSRHNPALPLLCEPIASWDAPSPSPALPVDRIVGLHYFSDTATACTVLEGGDIVVVEDGLTPEHVHIEIVGSVDAGITAARWSPDEELLVITTKANTVVFMTRSFDAIADATMTSADLAASKHVSVGWGKKETQFQGKGAKAKALRDPTIPEQVAQGTLSPNDDGRTSVSWRGDGAYVAINTVESASRRLIRVYTRDGELDGVSEPVDGLEGALSWRPAGNLMAGVQRFTDHVDIVFFERNGLRHGQFTLRSSEGLLDPDMRTVLEWNTDSTVLAVAFGNVVQLWTTGNYHWYLKQELLLQSPCSFVSWHPEKALRIAVASLDTILQTESVFTVARGSLMPPHDFGAVAVIDGNTVKITPFRTANVPPPMAMYELVTSHTVIDVAFAQDNSCMAVLHHGGLQVFEWETKDGRSLAPRLLSTCDIKFDESVQNALQISLTSSREPDVLYFSAGLKACRFDSSRDTDRLVASDPVLLDEEEALFLQAKSAANRSERVETGDTHFQTTSGRLVRLSSTGAFEPLTVGFPTQLPWVEMIELEDGFVAFGLSRSGHLYANARLLVKNCTSFLVTCDHLIFTTSNHFLKFVHLSRPEDLDLAPDDPEQDERCRSIERGARLVTAMPTTMSVVLQMPRGNLETIYPRAMVLAGIRHLINQKAYGKAFLHCRTQRVDMNILYDHRPEQFLPNVGLFLDQLNDVSHIDLFLASLREDDVTKTMYRDTSRTSSGSSSGGSLADVAAPTATTTSVSKVNLICDSILKTLQARKDTNLQNIITANVCKNPPALEDGLQVVAELMQEDEAMAEKAVEHICFLQDVNRLYDNALGLYNLDLALLVAQQSQRDPREYLPFIQNLHQKPDVRRKFAIDDHLGRREKALQHLHALNVFDEVQTYITRHNLYQAALRLYRYDTERHNAVTDLYATHLESQSKYREAGLAFESLHNFVRATACYRAAGAACWRECLFTARRQDPPLSASSLSEVALALADALWEAKDYTAAATIHLEYLNSVEDAVCCLCKGYLFADAMRVVVLRNRTELLESAVESGLADALSSSTEFLADCKAQLRAQVPRIQELRRKAIEDPLAFYEGERPSALVDIPDDVSIASSRVSTSASLFTRYTGKAGSVGTLDSKASRATSKNRKREEKKRARGRKGTVYEAEYLINSVRRLVERVESSKGEIERLVFGLMRRDMAERARAVEALMHEVVEACRAAVTEVFGTPEEQLLERQQQQQQQQQQSEDGGRTLDEAHTLSGPDGVLQASLDAANAQQVAPVISAFAKLSLLG